MINFAQINAGCTLVLRVETSQRYRTLWHRSRCMPLCTLALTSHCVDLFSLHVLPHNVGEFNELLLTNVGFHNCQMSSLNPPHNCTIRFLLRSFHRGKFPYKAQDEYYFKESLVKMSITIIIQCDYSMLFKLSPWISCPDVEWIIPLKY